MEPSRFSDYSSAWRATGPASPAPAPFGGFGAGLVPRDGALTGPSLPLPVPGPTANWVLPDASTTPGPTFGPSVFPRLTFGPQRPPQPQARPSWGAPAGVSQAPAPAPAPFQGSLLPRQPPAPAAGGDLGLAFVGYRLVGGSCGWVRRAALAERLADTPLGRQLLGQEQAPRDDNQRVIIDCHPTRWAQIAEFIACGAVPDRPGTEIIAQARAFGISALVERLEAAIPGVDFLRSSSGGAETFRARFTFCGVVESLVQSKPLSLSVYDSDDLLWTVSLQPQHFTVTVAHGHPESAARQAPVQVRLKLSLRARGDQGRHLQEERECPFVLSKTWLEGGRTLDELVSEEVALHRGGVAVQLDVARLPAGSGAAARLDSGGRP